MKSNRLAKLIYWLLYVFIVLTAIILLTLPLLVDTYMKMNGARTYAVLVLEVFLYGTAIPFTVLLLMSHKLCRNILQNNPFCLSSITSLRVIGICAFIDFLLYVSGTILILKNLLSLTIMIGAFMIGLVSFVLSQLFREAMELKEENDLTI